MNILLSIKPKYADLIYKGIKTIEWRKTFPYDAFYGKIFIYETAPVSMVTGCFRMNQILNPIILDKKSFKFISPVTEKQIENWGQVSIDFLKKYAENGSVWGWHITDAKKLKRAVNLEYFHLKRPPQSWQYLNNKE